MMRRTPLKPGTKPMKRSAFKRADRIEAREEGKIRRAAGLKTKQRPVTPAEKEFHDRLAALGCIACMKDGVWQPLVSIHHIDGRTKEGCHQLVLPLCAGHHQDGTGENKSLIAVHPWKARFEARYGTQRELLAECMYLLTNPSSAVVQADPSLAEVEINPRQITIFELAES